MKRVISFILIILLVLCTGIPVFTSNLLCSYVYADDELSNDEKVELAIATYYNSRNGYVTSSSANPALSYIIASVNQFYSSPANTTGIESSSDFAQHITINNNPFTVNLDSSGINFLNHLVRYLCGQNEFPHLYSGGSWGSQNTTNDDVYDGYINGSDLFYVVKNNNFNSESANKQFAVSPSEIKTGTPARGYSYSYLKNLFDNRNNNNVDYTSTSNSYNSVNFTINWSSDKRTNSSLTFTRSGPALARYYFNPQLNMSGMSATNIGDNVVDGASGVVYCNNGTKYVIGNPAFILVHNVTGNVKTLCYGSVSYSKTDNKYIVVTLGKFGNNDSANTPTNVNFETDDFVKEDTESEESITYTPKDTDNNNTFNTYNEYINNYIIKKTYIDNGSSSDPDDPSPGGTTPPWTGSTGGTATPDGNGGFNLTFPDLTLPDLDIDWSLRGLTEKFPFSIPFDLMAFFTVLNAEPQTPEIQATIPLGIWEWDIDWSLENFDGLASLLRNLEFIAFCIALLLITRSIIKG